MKLYIELMQKIPLWLLLLLATLSVVAGDYFAKFWSVNQKPLLLILAFIGYFLSGFFYIPTLLKSGLIATSTIWGLLSTIGFLLIGILIFHEVLTPLQTAATVLGVISLLLFSFSL